jgi:hypothetical protein
MQGHNLRCSKRTLQHTHAHAHATHTHTTQTSISQTQHAVRPQGAQPTVDISRALHAVVTRARAVARKRTDRVVADASVQAAAIVRCAFYNTRARTRRRQATLSHSALHQMTAERNRTLPFTFVPHVGSVQPLAHMQVKEPGLSAQVAPLRQPPFAVAHSAAASKKDNAL